MDVLGSVVEFVFVAFRPWIRAAVVLFRIHPFAYVPQRPCTGQPELTSASLGRRFFRDCSNTVVGARAYIGYVIQADQHQSLAFLKLVLWIRVASYELPQNAFLSISLCGRNNRFTSHMEGSRRREREMVSTVLLLSRETDTCTCPCHLADGDSCGDLSKRLSQRYVIHRSHNRHI